MNGYQSQGYSSYGGYSSGYSSYGGSYGSGSYGSGSYGSGSYGSGSYGSGSYGSGSYGSNMMTLPGYSSSSYADKSKSSGSYGGATGAAATITIKVPLALVDVLIDGQKMSETGKTRTYTTPGLQTGKSYSFTIQANWSEGGYPQSVTRTVEVSAGDNVTVDFTKKG
jgi:uncharacterized protein (TIGR03000 family)